MKKKFISLTSILLFIVLFVSCNIMPPNTVLTDSDLSDGLTVHFLDVGQGSSVLLESANEYMLIDGGDRDYSSFVVSYLKNQGVSELEYVIATHYDADHLNGVVGVLNAFDINTVLCPDDNSDTRVYKSFSDIINKKNIKKEYPDIGNKYNFGDASFTVICPKKYGTDSNNNSVGIKLKYGNTSAIFCGDAEIESEKDMIDGNIDLNADIYYVSHHGSDSSSSEEFIKAISPKYTVISCGKNNSYGHPHIKTIDTLKKYGCNIWRTDEQGTIICKSDGNNIYWNCNAGYESTDNVALSKPTSNSTDSQYKYVLNKSTKKFHLPDCPSCGDINSKNIEYYSVTRQELISSGYSPCKKCNP